MKAKKNRYTEEISEAINQAQTDIKAEALLASFLANGQLDVNEFITWHESSFKRKFSKDVNQAKLLESIQNKNWLQVNLARNGLYDILPEGLFFQPGESIQRTDGVPEMVQQYRHDQQEEKEIRLFFQPFEHEFFLHRVRNEQEESSLLKGLHSGMLDDYFIEFWNLPATISHQQALALILLMPYAHMIAGDMELMPVCLEKILDEQVKAVIKPAALQHAKEQSNILGSFIVGNNLVCGEMFDEDYPLVEFKIGPLKHSSEHDYLPGGKYYSLLEAYVRYFIPAEAEVIITIVLSKADVNSKKLKEGIEPVLGISAVLL
jgi:hypothetical protein